MFGKVNYQFNSKAHPADSLPAGGAGRMDMVRAAALAHAMRTPDGKPPSADGARFPAQPFLLRQMLELNEALRQPPARGLAQQARYASDPWFGLARQQLLRDIAARRAAGDSFGSIAHALNLRRVPGEHGGRWYGATVRKFLLRTQAETRQPDAFTLAGSGSGKQ